MLPFLAITPMVREGAQQRRNSNGNLTQAHIDALQRLVISFSTYYITWNRCVCKWLHLINIESSIPIPRVLYKHGVCITEHDKMKVFTFYAYDMLLYQYLQCDAHSGGVAVCSASMRLVQIVQFPSVGKTRAPAFLDWF